MALTEAFVISLGSDEPDLVERRARWLVRVLTSLLVFPGHDEADERSMLEEFVVPTALPNAQARTRVNRCNSQASGTVTTRVPENSTQTEPV